MSFKSIASRLSSHWNTIVSPIIPRCLPIVLFGALFYFYHDILSLWFLSDDIVALYHSTGSLREILLENRFSNTAYTPLSVLAVKPDFLLFGLDPLPYHLHNSIILTAVALLFYKTIRMYTTAINAFTAVFLFLFSLPSLAMVSWMVLRVYLYTMLFALIVIYLFIRHRPSLSQNKVLLFGLMIATEICFLGAEQFKTLPLVLLILASGNFRKRVCDTAPFFIVLMLHLALRTYVLQGIGGHIVMTFELKNYFSAIANVFPLTAEVLFGHRLMFLVLVLPMLFRAPRALLTFLLIGITALGIQLFTLYKYPDSMALRFWFFPTLLMCSLCALSAQAITNRLLHSLYLLFIVSALIINTGDKASNIKTFFAEESLIYQSLGNALLDKKYAAGVIVFFEDDMIEKSFYIKLLDALYTEKLGMRTYATFIPSDYLLFYPQIMKAHTQSIYEMSGSMIRDITTGIHLRLNRHGSPFLLERPEIALSRETAKGQKSITLACPQESHAVGLYVISKRTGTTSHPRTFYDRMTIPYQSDIPLRSLTKLGRAELVVPEQISFEKSRQWLIKDKELEPFPSEALVAFTCITTENKKSLPSNMLYLMK